MGFVTKNNTLAAVAAKLGIAVSSLLYYRNF